MVFICGYKNILYGDTNFYAKVVLFLIWLLKKQSLAKSLYIQNFKLGNKSVLILDKPYF